ncbi:MAG: hypothetical protein Q7V19_16095, partial [Bacteroidales bacterium]|nr:hypothetical protein [Bacteroidales bacterium]
MSEPFISKALEANLAETRYRDIYIPEEYLGFVQLSEGYFGIKKRAHDCITEYHHPLSNRKFVIEELREILITDFWFYTKENIPSDALNIPLTMLEKMLGEKLSTPLTTMIIQTLLEFVSLVMKQKPTHHQLVGNCILILSDNLSINSYCFILSTKFFVRYLPAASRHEDYEPQVLNLTKRVFRECYIFWQSSSSIEEWIDEKKEIF